MKDLFHSFRERNTAVTAYFGDQNLANIYFFGVTHAEDFNVTLQQIAWIIEPPVKAPVDALSSLHPRLDLLRDLSIATLTQYYSPSLFTFFAIRKGVNDLLFPKNAGAWLKAGRDLSLGVATYALSQNITEYCGSLYIAPTLVFLYHHKKELSRLLESTQDCIDKLHGMYLDTESDGYSLSKAAK